MSGTSEAQRVFDAGVLSLGIPIDGVETERDVHLGCDELPAAGPSGIVERKKRHQTQKIVRMPQRGSMMRDVLAAGKDLPEKPEDVPDAEK